MHATEAGTDTRPVAKGLQDLLPVRRLLGAEAHERQHEQHGLLRRVHARQAEDLCDERLAAARRRAVHEVAALHDALFEQRLRLPLVQQRIAHVAPLPTHAQRLVVMVGICAVHAATLPNERIHGLRPADMLGLRLWGHKEA
jgi:hypothetical protein